MDMQAYWARVRQEQARLCSQHSGCAALKRLMEDPAADLRKHLESCDVCRDTAVVLRSLPTGNGGVAGRCCQVDSLLAARFIVDQSHIPAGEDETSRWLDEQRQAQEKAKMEAEQKKLQISIIQGGLAGLQFEPTKPMKSPGR